MDPITVVAIIAGVIIAGIFSLIEDAFEKLLNPILRLIGLQSSSGPIDITVIKKDKFNILTFVKRCVISIYLNNVHAILYSCRGNYEYWKSFSIDDKNKIRQIILTDQFNLIAAFTYSKSIVKLLKNYITSWDYVDFSDYTPIMDCVKYSNYDSVKYMLDNADFHLFKTSINMLACSFYNNDLKVTKLVINYLKNREDINIKDLLKYN